MEVNLVTLIGADGLNSDSHGDYAVMVDTGEWSLSAL